MLLNFSDRTRTGAFSMIWPLAESIAPKNAKCFNECIYNLTEKREILAENMAKIHKLTKLLNYYLSKKMRFDVPFFHIYCSN